MSDVTASTMKKYDGLEQGVIVLEKKHKLKSSGGLGYPGLDINPNVRIIEPKPTDDVLIGRTWLGRISPHPPGGPPTAPPRPTIIRPGRQKESNFAREPARVWWPKRACARAPPPWGNRLPPHPPNPAPHHQGHTHRPTLRTPPTASPSTPNTRACTPPPPLRVRAPATFPPLAHSCIYPKESTPQHSVQRLKSTIAVQSTPAQSRAVNQQNFEMVSNTQEISNAVPSIIPVVKEKAATSSCRGRSLSPELFEADRVVKKVSRQPTARPEVREKAATSSGRGRSLSPDLFEEEDRVVKKVCRQPAARSGPIEKYRVACNRTNPYAGSWPTARKSLRPSTPPAAVVETPRATSPEEPVVLTPLAVPLSPLPATPANPQVLVP
nr:serine/arginine repetitive matrix protein 1-like [Leptinotarsa decemlineata]